MRGVFYFYKMHGFIKDVVKKISIGYDTDISKTIIVVPNKRSQIFLKKEISEVAFFRKI